MENYQDFKKKYIEEPGEAEREFSRLRYETYRAQLPLWARIPSVSVDSYISDVTAEGNYELARVAYMTAENIRSALQASEKQHIKIYPFLNLRNYQFNAAAAFLDDHYGLFALNAGVYYAINDICSGVVHRPEFMSDLLPYSKELTVCSCRQCGGPRFLNGWLSDYGWLASDRPETAPMWRPIVASSQPTPRATVGGYLMLRCLFWICAHEIGHLLLEHLSILGRTTYSESGDEIAEGKRLLRHVMEIEADMFATCIDVDIPSVREELESRIEHDRRNTTYEGPWPEATEELAARVLAVVPTLIGVVLAHNSNRESDTHPRPRLRFRYSISAFRTLMIRRGQESLLPEIDRLIEDYLVAAAVCVGSERLLDDFWKADTDEEFSSLSAELDRFEELHGTWSQRLLKYGIFQRYEGRGDGR